jgi:hypothetical protein
MMSARVSRKKVRIEGQDDYEIKIVFPTTLASTIKPKTPKDTIAEPEECKDTIAKPRKRRTRAKIEQLELETSGT